MDETLPGSNFKQQRVLSRGDETKQHPFCKLPLLNFAGSALRTGGGYAQAALHVLETPKPEGVGRGDEDDGSDDGEERQGQGQGQGAMDGGGRKASSSGVLLGLLESAASTSRKQSFNKFQT